MTDVIYDGNKFDRLSKKDRDFHAFTLDDDGYVVRRTSAKGEFKPQGMTDFKLTTMEVTDVETALPSAALLDRRSLTIFNTSASEVLYFNKTGVVADRSLGNDAGWEIQPNSSINIDFAADVPIYAIAESGKTIVVKLMEIS